MRRLIRWWRTIRCPEMDPDCAVCEQERRRAAVGEETP